MKYLEPFAQPSFLLRTEASGNDPVSRLGGAPNLPPSLEWPVWKDKPLPFVAQLDLAELPVHSGIGLPASGCLYFFYEGGESAWGFDPDDKDAHAVRYVPELSLKDLPLRPLPPGIDDIFHFKPVGMRFHSLTDTFPQSQDHEFEKRKLTKDEIDEHFDHLQELLDARPVNGPRIGGYSDPVQGDPRADAQYAANGYFCGDPDSVKRAVDAGLDVGIPDWQLLLQVDSVDEAGMMWGDAGMIYFLIRRQDLAAEHFERTWLVFQCC